MVALQYCWLQTLLHTDWTSLMLLMSLTDLPKDIYDYVHRIGRSGRAGKSGLATAFFCNKNLPLAKALIELMQESNQEVPSWLKQNAERSTSVGQGKCYRASRFGGYDYRNAQSGRENYNSSSNFEGPDSSFDASVGSSYGASNAGPAGGGECYVAANADSYAPCGYELTVAWLGLELCLEVSFALAYM